MALRAPETEVVDAMDRLWFCRNVLFYEPRVVNLQSKLTVPKNISAASSDGKTKNKSRPERLNIVRGQPLFQLQSKAGARLPSPSSSPSMSAGSHPERSKRKERGSSYKRSSELENFELKGFMDPGLPLPKGNLSSHVTSMVPGLRRLEEEERGINKGRATRPYLSEAWIFNSPNSPLINLRMLPSTHDGVDMKKHLKFWARKVAMLLNEEP